MADTCRHCNRELEPSYSGPCPNCGKTGKIYNVILEDGIIIRDGFQARHWREGFKKFMVEVISRWLPSHNARLPKGVLEDRVIDKEHNRYDQVVKDASSGEVVHEEHVPLSKHKTEPRRS